MKDTYEWIPESTYLIFGKGYPQIYRKLDGHYINDWIHFDIEPYHDFFEKLGIPLNTPINLKETKEIEKMTSDMFIEYFTNRKDRDDMLRQKAEAMLYRFAELYHDSIGENKVWIKHLSAFKKLREQILNFEYRPSHNVDDIAAEMKLSRSYLQHLYKKFFNVSIIRDLIQARLKQAQKLLETTDYSIGEIAEIAGYDNVEHFSRQFKNEFGVSPRKYRAIKKSKS